MELLNKILAREKALTRSVKVFGNIMALFSIGISLLINMGTSSSIEIFGQDSSKIRSQGIELAINVFVDSIEWLFTFSALLLIPFLSFMAQKISSKYPIEVGGRSLNFVPLNIAIAVPAIIFGLLWKSSDNFTDDVGGFGIDSISGILYALVLATIIFFILHYLIEMIPPNHVLVHTIIFSILLLTSLFLNQGNRFNIIPVGVFIGILGFIGKNSRKLGEIGKIISSFDIDETLREEAFELEKENTKIKFETLKTKIDIEKQKMKGENKELFREQFRNKRKFEFEEKTESIKFSQIETKIGFYNQIYDIVSKQLGTKIQSQLPILLKQLEQKSETASAKELKEMLENINTEMNALFSTMPSLKVIEADIKKAFKSIENPKENLDSEIIERIQIPHQSEDAEIIPHSNPKSKTKQEVLLESEFWKIIDLLDWKKAGNDEAIVEPVIQHLTKLSIPRILQFKDKLSEKLYQLDTLEIAAQDGENGYREGNHFSVDLFLHFRCCIVANGKDYFERVLKNPSEVTPDLTFESLLYVAEKAHKRKTGEELEFLPIHQYETFSNKEGWKNR